MVLPEEVEMLVVEWWVLKLSWRREVWVEEVADHQVQVVVPMEMPPTNLDQKEGEPRQEARRACRVKWYVVLARLRVCCHEGGWMGGNENVVEEGWRYGDVPGREVVPAAVVGVCESGVAESVNGDCAGCPVGSVMLQVSNVGALDVGESGQSGSWENVVGHVGEHDVEIESCVMCDDCGEKAAWVAVVVHMD